MTGPGPLDGLLRPAPPPGGGDPALLAALARATAALARLDQAAAGHLLLPALLHRARLDAARRQAAVDGHPIDPWHLAALVEGLRPRRLAGAASIAEAGGVFEAGRAALAHHAWLTGPGYDAESEVRATLAALRGASATGRTAPGGGSTAAARARRCAPRWCASGSTQARCARRSR